MRGWRTHFSGLGTNRGNETARNTESMLSGNQWAGMTPQQRTNALGRGTGGMQQANRNAVRARSQPGRMRALGGAPRSSSGGGGGNKYGGGNVGQVNNVINAEPIYSDNQIQTAVNRGVSANDTQAGSALLQQLQNPNLSPAARHQLLNQSDAARMNANSQVRHQIPFDLASANRQHVLNAQQAQSQHDLGSSGLLNQLSIARMNNDTQRYAANLANQHQTMGNLLSLLGGI